MKEILAEDLQSLFDNSEFEGKCTYSGSWYEVWEVSDETYEALCNMCEEEFENLCPYGMWRSSEGSIMGTPDYTFYIHGKPILAWQNYDRDGEYCNGCCDDDEEECFECVKNSRTFSKLTEYLCNEIGASQPRNVCALAVDLAKYNNMTMGELFRKYEG